MTKLVVGFDKVSSNKDDKNEVIKLHFSGTTNNLKFELKVSGDSEDVNNFRSEHVLEKFKQRLDVEINNNQASLD